MTITFIIGFISLLVITGICIWLYKKLKIWWELLDGILMAFGFIALCLMIFGLFTMNSTDLNTVADNEDGKTMTVYRRNMIGQTSIDTVRKPVETYGVIMSVDRRNSGKSRRFIALIRLADHRMVTDQHVRKNAVHPGMRALVHEEWYPYYKIKVKYFAE